MKNKHKTKVVTVDKYVQYKEVDEVFSSQVRKVELLVPSNLRMLCAILNIKVERILRDYMDMLSYAVKKNATEKQRNAARKFFLRMNYGEGGYKKTQVNQMLDDLKANRTIVNLIHGMNQENLELFWKNDNMYREFWFKQWFNQNSRKEDRSILAEY